MLLVRASQMAGRLPEIASENAALCCTPAGQDLLQVRDDCNADLLLAHHRAKPAMSMRASVQQRVSDFLHTSCHTPAAEAAMHHAGAPGPLLNTHPLDMRSICMLALMLSTSSIFGNPYSCMQPEA